MSEAVTKVVRQVSWHATATVPEGELMGMVLGAGPGADGWDGVLCLYTDRVAWTLPGEVEAGLTSKLLELRAYNREAELHAVRDCVGRDFAVRTVSDGAELRGGSTYDAHFDDTQFLDIDSKCSEELPSGRDYVATGGGRYRLPVEGAERIKVRNYISYGEDDGMARIVDFRIVELLKGGPDA